MDGFITITDSIKQSGVTKKESIKNAQVEKENNLCLKKCVI